MMWKTIVSAALLAQYANAQAMLRFGCTQLVVERTDPIVNPGAIYTPHMHQIIGGNSFNITMDPDTHDPGKMSTCTTCKFKEDKSNYWTAIIMYKSKDGKYMRVPTTGNGGPQGKLEHAGKGGMDLYYIPRTQGKVTAFQQGFRMIAGDAGQTDPSKVGRNKLCYRCWPDSNENRFVGGAPCSGGDSVEIPKSRDCKMMRQTLIFCDCWNGKDLDSANHQDHVAYSTNFMGANGGGSCPSSHPVAIPQIMYEIMWNATDFVTRDDWNDEEPYVLSMGIGGSASHGDYVFGWEGESLQKAMNQKCNLQGTCVDRAGGGNIITAQSIEEMTACTKPQQAPEQVDGFLDALPLDNMVQK